MTAMRETSEEMNATGTPPLNQNPDPISPPVVATGPRFKAPFRIESDGATGEIWDANDQIVIEDIETSTEGDYLLEQIQAVYAAGQANGPTGEGKEGEGSPLRGSETSRTVTSDAESRVAISDADSDLYWHMVKRARPGNYANLGGLHFTFTGEFRPPQDGEWYMNLACLANVGTPYTAESTGDDTRRLILKPCELATREPSTEGHPSDLPESRRDDLKPEPTPDPQSRSMGAEWKCNNCFFETPDENTARSHAISTGHTFYHATESRGNA